MVHFATAAFTLILERLTGYPQVLQRHIRHPVEWLGWLIGLFDEMFNRPDDDPGVNRLRGLLALSILIAITLLASLGLAWTVRTLPFGWIIEACLAIPFLAQRSLREHVGDVVRALENSLDQGRVAVSRIVGRDPRYLDSSGVSRAALESLAENTSDGIVAPACWLALFGLPGIAVYKAINTADSMIGHRTPRYETFGWASARLDDLVNWPFSRLTGLLFAGAAWLLSEEKARLAVQAMRRDARHHVSPNAGWPEAALAGALGIRLGGPRQKDGVTIDLAWMGDGREVLDTNDIRAGLRLYGRALSLLAALFVCAALVSSVVSASLPP
jgi:adenosylcobinamide-phosphate synthase